MTGLINVYQVRTGYGIAPYSAVYFSVDVEGFDSASGVKGRWMLQGVYGPEQQAPAALQYWYGMPVRNGSSRKESGKHWPIWRSSNRSAVHTEACTSTTAATTTAKPHTSVGEHLVAPGITCAMLQREHFERVQFPSVQ
jgi:hypothetical protein